MNEKCLAFLISLIPLSWSKLCDIRTESDDFKIVCCADYEKQENNCIACSTGFTSKIGQSCKPCPHNTFGERCGYECSCLDFESCDNVKGCVGIPSTKSTSTSTTIYLTSDITTAPRLIDVSTNSEHTNNNVKGLLSREKIAYYTLSLTVAVLGMCLCFILYKYKTVIKKKKITRNTSQNRSRPTHSQHSEIEERLYDVIDDEDMLDNQQVQQMQLSSVYLEVINDPNSTVSAESNYEENQTISCQSMPQAETIKQNNKDDFFFLVDDDIIDNTSSAGEINQGATQDYLNPYQPMLEMSPPIMNEYLTLATINADTKTNTINVDEYRIKLPLDNGVLSSPFEYENYPVSVSYTVPRFKTRRGGSKSCENLNINGFEKNICMSKDERNVNFTANFKIDYYNLLRTKSESDIYYKHFQKR